MKPLFGVVQSLRGRFVTIRLQTGRIIKISKKSPTAEGLLTGKRIWAFFDYGTNQIKEIREADKNEELMDGPEYTYPEEEDGSGAL